MHTEEKPRKLPASPSEGVSTNCVMGEQTIGGVVAGVLWREGIPDQCGLAPKPLNGTGTATLVRNLTGKQPSLPNPTPNSHRSIDHPGIDKATNKVKYPHSKVYRHTPAPPSPLHHLLAALGHRSR